MIWQVFWIHTLKGEAVPGQVYNWISSWFSGDPKGKGAIAKRNAIHNFLHGELTSASTTPSPRPVKSSTMTSWWESLFSPKTRPKKTGFEPSTLFKYPDLEAGTQPSIPLPAISEVVDQSASPVGTPQSGELEELEII